MKKSYLIGKQYGELSEEEQEALKLMITGTYRGILDLDNGLSVPGKMIEENNEIIYKIDDQAVIYDPIAWKTKKKD